MKRSGFTLIELIVALAVILILAAILVPLMAESRWQYALSNNTRRCSQNARQIGLAIKQYLQDYNESFPIVAVGANPYGWADACQPYVRNTQLFQCPFDRKQPPTGSATTVVGSDPQYTDYFFNANLAGRNEAGLLSITTTVMLGDAAPGTARQHSTGGASKIPATASLVNRSGTSVGATRHLGGAVYVFADSHAKWLKGKDANTCPDIKNVASGARSNGYGFAIQ